MKIPIEKSREPRSGGRSGAVLNRAKIIDCFCSGKLVTTFKIFSIFKERIFISSNYGIIICNIICQSVTDSFESLLTFSQGQAYYNYLSKSALSDLRNYLCAGIYRQKLKNCIPFSSYGFFLA